ncbi:MAG: peptide deformylase [Pseudomonadota bacterium]
MKLIIAPNAIFRKAAQPVTLFDDALKQKCADMLGIMKAHNGIGIAANMVGLLERIIIAPNPDTDQEEPIAMINPEITYASEEENSYAEASLSFPGIQAMVSRPHISRFSYFTADGGEQVTSEAEGFISTVIQHEIDYLDGKVFLDYLLRACGPL